MRSSAPRHLRLVAAIALTFPTLASFDSQARVMTPEQAQAWEKEAAREQKIEERSNDFDHSNNRPTLELLWKLKLKSGVDWANEDIQSVLNEITARAEEVDPGSAVKFTMRMPRDAKQVDVLGRRVDRNVSFATNENATIFDLLLAVSGLTNLSFKVEKNEVIFMQWQPGNFIVLPVDMPM